MKDSRTTKALKFAGGGIIVAAAVFIVMPDLLAYATRLWHLAVFIGAIVVLAWLLSIARLKITRNKPVVSDKSPDKHERVIKTQ